MVSLELAVEQVLISVYLLSKILPLSFSSNFGQNPVLFHNSKYRFGIIVNSLIFQSQIHPPITAGLEAMRLLSAQFFCQHSVLFRLPQPLYKVVVSASGHTEESAHDRYRILAPVLVDYLVLELWLHILSVSERKSRNNLFSIFKHLFSLA